MRSSTMIGKRRLGTELELEIHRGEVWNVTLDPVIGSEMRKTRPCVIVQRDAANHRSPTTIVCPLTSGSQVDANLLNIFVSAASGIVHDSLVVCNQVRSVDKRRIVGNRVARLDAQTMSLIDTGLRAILDLRS